MSARKSKTVPSPTPKAEKKRSEILRAATRCFRKTGFHQTSMQEICAEIGLGPGAVYRYFSSKDAIIEAMAEEERRQARAILQDLRQAEHLPDALTSVALAFAERYAAPSDVSLMTEVYAEGLRNKRVGNVVRKTETEWIDGLTDLLCTAQARGHVDPALDARNTALLLTALWDGMIIRQAYSVEDQPRALLACFDMMLRRLLVHDGKTDKRTRNSGTASAEAQVVQVAPVTPPKDAGARMEAQDPRQMSLI
ncbi:MAG TPA: TetR/AcrR family transcriptional regulator [Noviherbaspirillum sp.]|uniref:TetR/AcrR family transcriptional regulator n=1 Tax=Noviherbaspirillum sp. TaxID=1926288 RepID=UPI002D58F9E8|nr:TetR/AcrR family transcriptional regulator [Noviherbaspirillum sp.]HYD97098.1 TetR/AcrR family transcriptional regulator [Noviherbaspirillum sp.]